MSRIDIAILRAAAKADAAPAPSKMPPMAVAEITFAEDARAPEREPLLSPLPRLRDEPPDADDLLPDPPAVERTAAPAPPPRPPAPRQVAPTNGNGTKAAVPPVVPAPVAVAAAFPGALFHGFAPHVREKLVVGEHAGKEKASAVAIEQFRRLAAALHHAQIEREIRVVMVTSAIASEGKTLTASNLALTLSESYRRNVLLIDADLRRPGLHEIFQLPNTSGLHEGLNEEGAGHKLSLLEITPHLMLLPAGRPDPDPMSLLTSSKMQRVIEEASSRFDWVIVDAPPVGVITDASLLGKMVDTTLLVIQAGRTDFPIVRRAVDAIGRDRIFGVVLNRITLPESPYGYKYDRYYAPYRSGEQGKLTSAKQ